MIIYNESDYLEAHLTEISSDSQNWSNLSDMVPQRLADSIKKFAKSDSDPRPSPKGRPSKSRRR